MYSWLQVIPSPERIFLIVAFVTGLSMVFITGPFQGPDEFNHFYRTYQIAEGQLLAKRIGERVGGWLPSDIFSAGDQFRAIPFHPEVKIDFDNVIKHGRRGSVQKERRVFVEFPNTALYLPAAYSPQALGVATGNIIGCSALSLVYCGRIMGLLCWMAIIWTAIRITPILKWTVFLIALMPMHLFVAAVLSSDPLINATSILLLALILRADRGGDEFLGVRILTAIGVLCVFLSVTKFVYLPFLGLLVLIPQKRFHSSTYRLFFCSLVLASTLLGATLWGAETKNLYVNLNGSNIVQQLAFIESSPTEFANVLVRTFRLVWFASLEQFVGLLGWLDTKLPSWIVYTYPVALVASALLDSGEGIELDVWKKALLGFVCLLGSLLIPTALYLTWTEPSAQLVNGLQGRYFIPFALPALIPLTNLRFHWKNKMLFGVVLSVYSIAVSITSCVTLYWRYYG